MKVSDLILGKESVSHQVLRWRALNIKMWKTLPIRVWKRVHMLGRPLMARQPPFGQKLSFTEASPFVQAAFFTEHALRHSHLTPSLVQWGILLRQLLLTASFFGILICYWRLILERESMQLYSSWSYLETLSCVLWLIRHTMEWWILCFAIFMHDFLTFRTLLRNLYFWLLVSRFLWFPQSTW